MMEKQNSTKPAKGELWQGAFLAFSEVLRRIGKNPQPAVLFLGVYLVASIISMALQTGTPYADVQYKSFEDLTFLVFLLALPVYVLAIADKKKISLGEFMKFDLFKFFSILAATILTLLVVGVSLLLIIPVIWTLAWFAFPTYVVVDEGNGPIAAMKKSKQLAKNNKSKVWGVIGVTILIGIVAGVFSYVPVVGGLLAASASLWSLGAFAMLYRWLQHNTTPAK